MNKIALLLVWMAVVTPVLAEEQNESRRKEPQTYESPVLSLLLLPVNVLIKMASVFGPTEPDKTVHGAASADSSSK